MMKGKVTVKNKFYLFFSRLLTIVIFFSHEQQGHYLHSLTQEKHSPQLGQTHLGGIKTFHWFSHVISATPISPVTVFDDC